MPEPRAGAGEQWRALGRGRAALLAQLAPGDRCAQPASGCGRVPWHRLCRITGSQNGRGWEGPLWVTQPNPLPKQGHPEQAAQDCIQVGLQYRQRRSLHSLPGQPVPVLRHPQREEILPRVQLELPLLQFVPIAHCPLSCLWAPLQRVWPRPPDPHPADICKHLLGRLAAFEKKAVAHSAGALSWAM